MANDTDANGISHPTDLALNGDSALQDDKHLNGEHKANGKHTPNGERTSDGDHGPEGSHSLNGGHALNGDLEEPIVEALHLRSPNASHEDARTIQTVRGLVLDCVEQYENGHGGDRLRIYFPTHLAH